jgi:hypothetical protein
VVEKGASFKNATETTIDASTGKIEVHYTDKDGHSKVEADRLELPGHLANGMLFTLLKNIDVNSSGSILSMVAITPKPRLVKLVVTSLGEDTFVVGGTRRKATHYVLKVEIGGAAGLMAPLIGKKPPDTHVWILGGEAPAFVNRAPWYTCIIRAAAFASRAISTGL